MLWIKVGFTPCNASAQIRITFGRFTWTASRYESWYCIKKIQWVYNINILTLQYKPICIFNLTQAAQQCHIARCIHLANAVLFHETRHLFISMACLDRYYHNHHCGNSCNVYYYVTLCNTTEALKTIQLNLCKT